MCTDLKAAHGHVLWGMISLHGPKGTILSDPDRGLFILEENPVCKDTLQSASSHSLLTHKHTDTGFIHPTVRLCFFHITYTHTNKCTKSACHAWHTHVDAHMHTPLLLPEVPEISPKVQEVGKTPSMVGWHKRSHQSLSPIENNRAVRFRDPHHPQSLPIKITLTGALIEAEGNLLSSAITQCIFMFL